MAKDKVLVGIEAINLVSKSECINQYPKVKMLIENYRERMKSISLSDIENLMRVDIETYNILMYSFKKIQEVAAAEWSQEKFVGDYKNKCQLCGNARLLHNYRIRNVKNNNVLIVGSECINKFPSIDNRSFDSRKHRRDQDKLIKETTRRNLLNTKFPGCKEDLDKWRGYYNNLELLMPENIDSRFNKLILESNNFYTNYIDGKYKNSEIDRLENWYSEFDDLMVLSKHFIADHINDRLVATKKIGDWLTKQNLKGVRQQIIKDGAKVNRHTIKYIGTSSFINLFKDIIREQFKPFGYELQQITDSKIIFMYRYKHSNIALSTSLINFMNTFGGIIFEERISSKETIIDNLGIDWEEENVMKFEWELDNLLEKTVYNLDLMFRENILNILKGSCVARVNAEVFLKNNRCVMGMEDSVAKKKLLNTIENISKWELKDDVEGVMKTMMNRY